MFFKDTAMRWLCTLIALGALLALIYATTHRASSEAEVYALAEVALYAFILFIFTAPLTLVCWLLRLRRETSK